MKSFAATPFYALLFVMLLLLTASCHTVKKSSTDSRYDSTGVHKSDSVSLQRQDSSFTQSGTQEKEDLLTIEFDTAAADHGPVLITAGKHFSLPVQQKVKAITVKTGEKVSFLQGGQISREDLVQHSDSSLTKLVQTESSQHVSRCSFPYLWLIIVAAILYWLWRRYVSFKI